ncbi:MAG: hypothetical protein KC613_12495, partial [Myxococcales bacterium]|nr:hypothetical protein [Myxococcales bacterium]
MMRVLKAAAVCLGLAVAPAAAQIPAVIHQEGLLNDAAGIPLAGPVDLTFRFYAAAAGGVALWTEDHGDVDLYDGYYSVLLGSVRALDPSVVAQARFVTIEVDRRGELVPRVPLAAVPFAFIARDVAGGKVDAGSVRIQGNLVIDD